MIEIHMDAYELIGIYEYKWQEAKLLNKYILPVNIVTKSILNWLYLSLST